MPLKLLNAIWTPYFDTCPPYVSTWTTSSLHQSTCWCGSDVHEHLRHLRSVLEILRDSKLSLNSANCLIAQEGVVFQATTSTQKVSGRRRTESVPSRSTRSHQPATTYADSMEFATTIEHRSPTQLQSPLIDLLRGATKKKDKHAINGTPQLSEAFVRCRGGIVHALRM